MTEPTWVGVRVKATAVVVLAANRSGPVDSAVLTSAVGAVIVRVRPFSADVPATESRSPETASTAC